MCCGEILGGTLHHSRNNQCGPMLRKDKIFDLMLILILIISILPTLILIYIAIDFCLIFRTLIANYIWYKILLSLCSYQHQVNKWVFAGAPIFWTQVCVVTDGWIVFISFHLHSSLGVQHNSYLLLAFADAKVEIFQLLTSITQCVKSQLFLCLHEHC